MARLLNENKMDLESKRKNEYVTSRFGPVFGYREMLPIDDRRVIRSLVRSPFGVFLFL